MSMVEHKLTKARTAGTVHGNLTRGDEKNALTARAMADSLQEVSSKGIRQSQSISKLRFCLQTALFLKAFVA